MHPEGKVIRAPASQIHQSRADAFSPSMLFKYFQELDCGWSGSEGGLERRWPGGFLVARVGETWVR